MAQVRPPVKPTADPLVGRVVAGCRLEQLLGAGAMAVVYRGTRVADGARVAVKMLTTIAAQDEENVKRQEREVAIGTRIRHPNIAAIHSGGCVHGLHTVVMELIEGASMESVIDARGRLPWREAAHLTLQVARGIAYLGEHGVIHRDIKPGNILLTSGGVAKLVDLGFAKQGDTPTDEALTMAGSSMGSPAYMPPEQVTDASVVSHTADVYGIAATFFHAVTGKTPYAGRTVAAIMAAVVRAPVPDPRQFLPELPAAISELTMWAMAKEPGHRPKDAASFVRELELAIGNPDDASRIRRLRRCRDGTWIVAGVVGLAALALAGLLWWLQHRP